MITDAGLFGPDPLLPLVFCRDVVFVFIAGGAELSDVRSPPRPQGGEGCYRDQEYTPVAWWKSRRINNSGTIMPAWRRHRFRLRWKRGPGCVVTTGTGPGRTGGAHLNHRIRMLPGKGPSQATCNLGDVIRNRSRRRGPYVRSKAPQLPRINPPLVRQDRHPRSCPGRRHSQGRVPSAGLSSMLSLPSSVLTGIFLCAPDGGDATVRRCVQACASWSRCQSA